MELYESAMAPSVMLIAAVMDLLEPNSEAHRKAEHARLARQARRHRPVPSTPDAAISLPAVALLASRAARR